ncbi:MAG: family 10 glycosylhydrolase [Ignavibacteria bacterium]|nr:family 10 glycosylhydrolase [Ignavibacteria bacterium]
MKSNKFIIYIFFNLIFYLINCSGQDMNKQIKLDGKWNYKFDDKKIGIEQYWFQQGKIIPDGEILVPGLFENQTGRQFDGWVWYFKEFNLDFESGSENIAIFFDAIDDDAKVWLNNKFLGEHQGYSESFYFDIKDKIKKGKNFLAVLVSDHGGPGGIYKSVSIKHYKTEEDLFLTEYSIQNSRQSLEWVKSGIIYEIFPRAFTKEGTFKALTKKLPQIKKLGVTTLWLMPIHPIGELKRKGTLGSPYSVKDYYEINPEYGTKEDFKNFVNEAHKLGFKVIIDEVLNHCSWDNELVKVHPEWFTKDQSGNLISPNSDWTDVVDFNYDNPELRAYMIEMLKYWVKEFDIDGFRFDVSELVPTDFWENARTELERIKPQFWLSEGTLPEHHLKAFDMTYSWNIYDLFKPMLDGKISPQKILNTIKLENYTFPKNSLRMRFNENHDKVRAAEIFGYDGSFITAAIVFAINGVPLVHAGQEVGEKRFSSLFEKTEINWPDNLDANEHFSFFKKLIELRKRNPFLSLGKIEPVIINDKVLAFKNIYNGKGIVAFFNFDQNQKSIDLNFVDELKNYELDINSVIGRKFNIDQERMGRPADKIFNIDSLGFVIFEVKEK